MHRDYYSSSSGSDILPLELVINFFLNRRTKLPTVYGWITISVVTIIAFNFLYEKRSTEPSVVGRHITQPDVAESVTVEPETKTKLDVGLADLQVEELKKIQAENLKGNQPHHGIPAFDPNKHIDEKKKEDVLEPEVKEIVDKPQPKVFPVPVLATPRVSCFPTSSLLMVVFSRPDNIGARAAIRRTWAKYDPDKYNVDVDIRWESVFVLGRSGTLFDKTVLKESEEFGDILQGDFEDSPFEDTRKFQLFLSWLDKCPALYVIKTADNIYHNMVSITGWLHAKHPNVAIQGNVDLYTGRLLRKDRPVRDAENPMYVPVSDYPGEFFPDMIHGPVYAFSYHTLGRLNQVRETVTPIAMEDAYIGLLAARARVRPVNNDHFQMLSKTHNVCHYLRMFFVYKVRPSEQLAIFNKVRSARRSRECFNAKWIDKGVKRNEI